MSTPRPGVEWKVLALQLVVLPAAIVAACVGIFLLFGRMAGGGKDAPALLADVRDSAGAMPWDANARWYAAHELPGAIERDWERLGRDPAFCRALIEVFENPREGDVRMRAWMAVAMGKLGHPAAAPVLREGLESREELTRYACAWALGALRDPAAADALSRMAKDPDPALRQVAVYALGALEDPAAVPALKQALGDPRLEVRWTAALWLARQGDPAAGPVLAAMRDPATPAPGLSAEEREAFAAAARKAGTERPLAPEPRLPAPEK